MRRAPHLRRRRNPANDTLLHPSSGRVAKSATIDPLDGTRAARDAITALRDDLARQLNVKNFIIETGDPA